MAPQWAADTQRSIIRFVILARRPVPTSSAAQRIVGTVGDPISAQFQIVARQEHTTNSGFRRSSKIFQSTYDISSYPHLLIIFNAPKKLKILKILKKNYAPKSFQKFLSDRMINANHKKSPKTKITFS